MALFGWVARGGAAQYPVVGGPGGQTAPAPAAALQPPVAGAFPRPTTYAPLAGQPVTSNAAVPRITTPVLKTPTAVHGAPPAAQEAQAPPAGSPQAFRITLEEAKHRALANNKLLNLGALNVQSKEYAARAARADYFPKVTGTAMYLHFQDDLGTVLTTQGRTVTGPRGRVLTTFPPNTINAAVLNQNTSFANLGFVQPITDLLKVRQGVKIARADQQIAQAEVEKGIRDLVSGVEQLYWGLLAIHRLRAGAAEGVRGAELLAKGGSIEGRIALVEARQGLQEAEKQLADLQEQLNALLDLPLCMPLILVEPELPAVPVRCAEEAIELALAASPELRGAQHTVLKAQAAVAAGRLDYVPSVAVIGGYVNQTGASYIQQDIGYIGVAASYTFVDWGKRKNVVRERNTMLSMAALKVRQTEDEVRQKTQKAFRELQETQQAMAAAGQLAELRKEAEKGAVGGAALMTAAKNRMLAEVEAVKAELAYRQAHVQLMSLIERR